MFHTFSATESRSHNKGKRQGLPVTRDSSTGERGSKSSSPKPERPKRSQVSRACDWCRANRIKCDDNQPCDPCRSRNGSCSNTGRNGVRSVPAAIKEIEKLKGKVGELQAELACSKVKNSPSGSSPSISIPMESPEDVGEGSTCNNGPFEGLWWTEGGSNQSYYSSSSSASYFETKLSSYISSLFPDENPQYAIEPKAARCFLKSPTTEPPRDSNTDKARLQTFAAEENMTRAHEEQFLSLFWESHFCTMPIVEEKAFREEYKELWFQQGSGSGERRRESPLVEIVLALCLQHGMAFVPQHGGMHSGETFDINDSALAGRVHYRRCQKLLQDQLERPSVSTLQSLIYASIYLRDASFLNLSHTTLAVAIRTAYMLGLHLDPPKHLPRSDWELRRRIWWGICVLDVEASIALGRPLIAQSQHSTCSIPSDRHEIAKAASSSLSAPLSGLTWLCYHTSRGKLVLGVTNIYLAFEKKCKQMQAASQTEQFQKNAQSSEHLAGLRRQTSDWLNSWVHDVVDELKTPRKDGGEPFSTDRSPLQLDPSVPLWLRRQRLLLELLYHNLAMVLYRPWINFSDPTGSSSTPLSDANTVSCLHHASTTTNILHQVLTNSDDLNGWHDAYKIQWNATLSIIGFIFTHAVCSATPNARKTLDKVVAVFDILGANFSVARSAAKITRDLAAKADALIYKVRTDFKPLSNPSYNRASLSSLSIPSLDRASSSSSSAQTSSPYCGPPRGPTGPPSSSLPSHSAVISPTECDHGSDTTLDWNTIPNTTGALTDFGLFEVPDNLDIPPDNMGQFPNLLPEQTDAYMNAFDDTPWTWMGNNADS